MENNDVYLYSMVYPKLIGLNLHITWGSSFDGFPTTLPWKSIREVAEMRRTSAQSSWWHLHRIPISHISSSDGIITYKLYIYDIYIYIHYTCIYYIYIYIDILSPEHSHISHDIHPIHHIRRIFALRWMNLQPTEASRGCCRPAGRRTRRWGLCGFTRNGLNGLCNRNPLYLPHISTFVCIINWPFLWVYCNGLIEMVNFNWHFFCFW